MFLTQNTDRKLVIVTKSSRYQIVTIAASKCKTLFKTLRSQSASLKKQFHSRQDPEEDGDIDTSPDIGASNESEIDGHSHEMQNRGRRREHS